MNVRMAAMTVFAAPRTVIWVCDPLPAPRAVNDDAKITWERRQALIMSALA